MRWLRVMGFALGGAIIGWLAGDMVFHPVAEVAEPAPQPRTASVPVCPKPAASPAGVRSLERLQLQNQVETLRAYNDAREGSPTDWPVHLPEAYQEPAIEDLLGSLLPTPADGTLMELDCSEYPCIAVVAFDDEYGDPYETLDAFDEALEEAGWTGPQTATGAMDSTTFASLRAVRFVAFPNPVDEERLARRIRFRFKDLNMSLQASVPTP